MSETKKANGYSGKKLIYLAVGLFFMFVFGIVCPAWSTVTGTGVKMLGVFLGWIVMMISGFGLMVPSLLAMFAMLLTGFYTPAAVMASGFGSSVALLCMFGMLLIYAFRNTKGDEVLIRYLISRPFLSGHPIRFLLVFNLAIALLSVFMDVGGMLLGFAFVNAVADVVGYEEDTHWKRYMMTSVLILSQCATNVLPSKGGSLLTLGSFSGALTEAGYTLDLLAKTY